MRGLVSRTVIPGEVVAPGEHVLPISIHSLSCRECRIGKADLPDGELTIWIGAIGPFRGARQAGEDRLVFERPLAPEIVAHYAGTLPDLRTVDTPPSLADAGIETLGGMHEGGLGAHALRAA